MVAPRTPQLAAALDRAFAEPEKSPLRHTQAIVVMKDGRVVAERYADGIGIDTPLLGFSATKSVISALAGILVRKGALKLHEPVPIAAWQGADDPRRAITLDHLLRHTAGLALGSSLQASLASALEPVNRMKFMEPDMAAYAESMPLRSAPGSAWNYHDGNTVILCHVIRQASGGSASKMMRFARQELFDPLGMRNVTIEFDASGNAEGSSQMLASARDWARFGQLYLNDGMAGGKRILPEGWVKYSASPTPNAWVGQGAGFWTNLGDSFGATYRTEHGWPRDAFFAKGTIGQYVIIVPSERLVIVRLGRSPNWPPEADGVFELVRDVVAATGSKGSWRERIERDASSFSPCGRRWREAPDEGFLRETNARFTRGENPSPVSMAALLIHLSHKGRGVPPMRAASYCRPNCVAFSTRSNLSSDRIASASWSARPFSTGRASVRNFCCIACASGNEFGSPEGSA